MKNILVFVLLTLFLYACGDSGGATSNTASAKKIDGGKIYKTYCVTCHGIHGDMGGSGAFDLTTSKLTLEERIQVITKGRKQMTSFETLLSPEKIEAVAKYVETLRK